MNAIGSMLRNVGMSKRCCGMLFSHRHLPRRDGVRTCDGGRRHLLTITKDSTRADESNQAPMYRGRAEFLVPDQSCIDRRHQLRIALDEIVELGARLQAMRARPATGCAGGFAAERIAADRLARWPETPCERKYCVEDSESGSDAFRPGCWRCSGHRIAVRTKRRAVGPSADSDSKDSRHGRIRFAKGRPASTTL